MAHWLCKRSEKDSTVDMGFTVFVVKFSYDEKLPKSEKLFLIFSLKIADI